MDPYLYILIISIAVIGAAVLLLLLAMIMIRLLSSRNKKTYSQKAREWENIYLDYLQGELTLEKAASLMAGEKRFYWLWNFFFPYLEALGGTDFEKTKALCREIGLIDHFKKKLRGGSSSGKARAARILGTLRCRESVPEMIRLLQSSNPLIVHSAAQGLARSGETDTFFPVAGVLLNNTFFTYEGTTEILTDYGKKACPVIVQFLKDETAEQPGKKRDFNIRSRKKVHGNNMVPSSVYISLMVDLLGYFQYREALPLLSRMLEQANEETTVHILKFFLRIGEVPAGFDIKPYLEHYYWVVRSFSVQVWKLTGDRHALPILENLLDDRHWWVRFHAAEALRSAGEPGLEILKRKISEPAGAAAKISRYALNRSEV